MVWAKVSREMNSCIFKATQSWIPTEPLTAASQPDSFQLVPCLVAGSLQTAIVGFILRPYQKGQGRDYPQAPKPETAM